MRRVFSDALISAGALLVLLATLVVLDDRVRRQAGRLLDRSSGDVGMISVGQQVNDLSGAVLATARDLSLLHGPLMIFAVAAVVLVVCMLRT